METPTNERATPSPPTPAAESEATPTQLRELDSAELFQGEKSIAIRHGGALYRLLVTRHNRLILQK